MISSVALTKYYINPLNSSVIKFSILSTILSLGVNFGLRYCSLSLLYNDSEECGNLIQLALERSTNDFNKLALEERNQDALKNLLKTEFDKLFMNVDTSNVFNKLSHVLILNISIVDNKLNSICSIGEKIDLGGSIDVTKPLFINVLKIHLNHSVFKCTPLETTLDFRNFNYQYPETNAYNAI